MVEIKRTDLSGAGPVYDLTPAGELEKLDEMAPQAAVSETELAEIEAFEQMLGLRDVPAQEASLKPPPQAENPLVSQSGAQIRGTFRKLVINFRFNEEQVKQTEVMQQDRPEVQSVLKRMGHVEAMVDQLDGILHDQDEILGRMASEHKA